MSENTELLRTERVRIIESQVLSDDWYLLKKTVFDFRRADGRWQRQQREPTIEAMAPLCCFTSRPRAPWC